MSGTPGENDWFERVNKKAGQDPKGPIQMDGDTVDKDKGQERADIEVIENNEENIKENEEESKEEPIEIGKSRKKVWICGICKTMVNKGSVKCMGCSKWIHRRYVQNSQIAPA